MTLVCTSIVLLLAHYGRKIVVCKYELYNHKNGYDLTDILKIAYFGFENLQQQ